MKKQNISAIRLPYQNCFNFKPWVKINPFDNQLTICCLWMFKFVFYDLRLKYHQWTWIPCLMPWWSNGSEIKGNYHIKPLDYPIMCVLCHVKVMYVLSDTLKLLLVWITVYIVWKHSLCIFWMCCIFFYIADCSYVSSLWILLGLGW